MNIFELKQKPLWQMTGDDLLSLMRHEREEETAAEESLAAKQAERRHYVYGIRGIAERNSAAADRHRLRRIFIPYRDKG